MTDIPAFLVLLAGVLAIYGLGYWQGRAAARSKPPTDPPDLWREVSRYESKDSSSVTEAACIPIDGVTLKVADGGKVLVIERRRFELR